MLDKRRSGGQIALFVLSLLGIAISIYLTTVHYQNVPLVCSDKGFINCGLVLSSFYSVVPGTSIPISVPGLLWNGLFAVLAFMSWRVWPERRSLLIAELVLAASGMLTIFYLIYVELVRLHTLCAWCTALHVVILSMFIITVLQLQQAQSDESEFEEAEEEEPSTTVSGH